MLTGTVRHRDGKWFVEYSAPAYSAPEMLITTWAVTGAKRVAHYGPAPELADGLTVTYPTGGPDWQAYERGNYLVLYTEHEGSQRREPIPCPRVRKGIETRYHDGRWEKLLRAGWSPA